VTRQPATTKTALFTGITGEDAAYLAEFLHNKSYQIQHHRAVSRRATAVPCRAPLTQLFCQVPKGKMGDVARMLKAGRAQEAGSSTEAKLGAAISKLETLRLTKVVEVVEAKVGETLIYFAFPSNHVRQIRTNNPLEWTNRAIHRQMRLVGAFFYGHSALMLVAAPLRHFANTKWGERHYFAMQVLLHPRPTETAA